MTTWIAGSLAEGYRQAPYNRNTLYEPIPRPSDLPMAVSGRRRFDDDKVVRYETAEKDFEVEVSRTLNKWCVTVYQQPDRQILVFIRLLNQRKKKEEEGAGSGDDDY